jgi:AhpD family alkylhydroperoxidase
MATLISKALRTSLNQVRYVEPVRPGVATPQVAAVYEQVERDFGMLAPPIALHSPAPSTLAASWILLRETLLAKGLVDRAAKEVVAATVSRDNGCPYCVAVHGATLDGLVRRSNELDSITDPAMRAIASWTHASATADSAEDHEVPFPADHAPELIGVAITFQYLNRMVNVFLGDSPLPPSLPQGMRGPAMKFLGGFMRTSASKNHEPGASVDLLPAAELPADVAWAIGNPVIADGVARAAVALDGINVPPAVRDLLSTQLAEWCGQPMGIGRRWLVDAVAPLSPVDRPAGRLALLTALASYQVDHDVVHAFRATQPYDEDEALIELTSWASLAAARRIGSWMWARIADSSQS